MTKEFLDKVIAQGSVDTEKYRYRTREAQDATAQWLEIIRIPLENLDTTAAIDGWEVVARVDG